MSNQNNTVIYTGVTNDLFRRVNEHKKGKDPNSYSSKYQINKLVYYEEYQDAETAIVREKLIKGGSRRKKVLLIETQNKNWKDLSAEW